jgi:transitional endoplasmic reticulum ATPase
MCLMSMLIRRSNRVRVTNIDSDDNSVIFFSKYTIQNLKLSNGDVVLVKGKNRRTTILIILANDDLDDGNAGMNNVVKFNLEVRNGDMITIQPCLDIKCVSGSEICKILALG